VRLPRVLVLTDRAQLPPGRTLEDTLVRCVDAGLEAVVVRELDLPDEQRQRLVEHAVATGATVISARTWFPAAPGVHLSAVQTGLDARPAAFHGRSCHNAEEVRRAVGGGASYLTISPVAETPSKPGHGPPTGVDGVRRAATLAGTTPVFALGGVDVGNAAAMREAGAYGVAVMGAVMRAEDPAAVLRTIMERLR
jgi:thiamine-phosphate pyrophosphorylase